MIQTHIPSPQGLEFGLYTLGDHLPDPNSGVTIPAYQRLKEITSLAIMAEEAGLDSFSVGESHQVGFATQAHALVLAAIAQATSRIRIFSTSTIISTSDPVRVFENFATLDLISHGRAEIVAGRASRIGLFELLGYDLKDYEDLYEEKLDLLLKINNEETVTWEGRFRPALQNARVLPRPMQERLPIWRAVGGTPASAVRAGRMGVPMVLAHLGGPVQVFKRMIDTYRETARGSGFDPDQLPVATAGLFWTAETTQQAQREFFPHLNEGIKITNGRGFSRTLFAQGAHTGDVLNVGSAQQIIEKILYQHEMFGHRRYLAQIDFGGIPFSLLQRNIEAIGTHILPEIRKHLSKNTRSEGS